MRIANSIWRFKSSRFLLLLSSHFLLITPSLSVANPDTLTLKTGEIIIGDFSELDSVLDRLGYFYHENKKYHFTDIYSVHNEKGFYRPGMDGWCKRKVTGRIEIYTISTTRYGTYNSGYMGSNGQIHGGSGTPVITSYAIPRQITPLIDLSQL
jgi:hypothetical protein